MDAEEGEHRKSINWKSVVMAAALIVGAIAAAGKGIGEFLSREPALPPTGQSESPGKQTQREKREKTGDGDADIEKRNRKDLCDLLDAKYAELEEELSEISEADPKYKKLRKEQEEIRSILTKLEQGEFFGSLLELTQREGGTHFTYVIFNRAGELMQQSVATTRHEAQRIQPKLSRRPTTMTPKTCLPLNLKEKGDRQIAGPGNTASVPLVHNQAGER